MMRTSQRFAALPLVVGLLLVSASVALAACSLLLPLGAQQCSVDSDCTSRGGAFAGTVCASNVCVLPKAGVEGGPGDGGAADAADEAAEAGPWDCLDQPGQVLDLNATVGITFIMFDALKPIDAPPGGNGFSGATSYTPVSGVSLQACDILDPQCTKPITPLVTSNDAGVANVTLAQNFAGFFQFWGAGSLPSTVYPGHLLADASTETMTLAVLGGSETQLLAAALGVPMQTNPDAGVGSAFFQAYDCFDRAAPGVSYTLPIDGGPETVQWYSNNQLPSTTATQTDSQGVGGVLNVPAGALAATATLAGTNRQLGTTNAIIYPGGLTYVWFRVRTH
jgi:hypothetical protein